MRLRKIFFSLFFVGLIVFSTHSFGQNTSNRGKDFWVAYSGHVDALSSRLTLFLSADQATDYEIFVGTTLISNGTISANTCLPFVIDPNQYAVYIANSNVTESNKAIRVKTVKSISLYCVISNSARTGGTMVLPANTLGKDYYTFSYQSSSTTTGNVPVFSQFTIIATEDGTEVEITPTRGERNNIRIANVPFRITLNKGDIYQYQAVDDLSGSYVRSVNGCRPIAVFSGNTWASFCEQGNTRSPSGGDNLYQQMFPISSWGKKFVMAPFYNTLNGSTDIIRVIVAEDNTTISVNGSTAIAGNIPLSNPYAKGSVVTFFSTSGNVISATSPISVAQYQISQTCNPYNSANINNGANPYLGDPEITILNPIEQTLNNVTVYSKLQNVPTNIEKFYLNVIIKTIDIASFKLDGLGVSGFVPIDNEYSYVIIDVTNLQPQHRLTASGGFSAIAYGYGRVESYAYLAGANIQNFTFQPENVANAQPITNGCVGSPIRLKINLPYQATKLKWDVNTTGGPIDQSNPTPTGSFVKDNITYYTYLYPNTIVYNSPGDYRFFVETTKRTPDDCGATEELSVDFTVDPLPTASYNSVLVGCSEKEIQFSDISNSNIIGRSITKWEWNFGDPLSGALNLSAEQNPKHIFSNIGDYVVSLKVWNENGCAALTVFSKTIKINLSPKINFDQPMPICIEGGLINFNAAQIRTIGGNGIYSGNGVNAAGVFNPVTAGIGKHSITYTYTTINNCIESKTNEIEVVAKPIVTVEKLIYILLGGTKVMPVTAIGTNLTYEWTPRVGLSAYDIQNPIVTVNATTKYTLKVSVSGLCAISEEIQVIVLDELKAPNIFTPNGDGINDVWNIPSLDSYPNSETSVFNRSGQKVFFSKGYINPFDGNFQNRPLPIGVYYYRISPNNGRKTISGALTIIR
ncbi:MAG: gliding motility-associated C-terminal domain-containing protein [Bacteroidota bacterium]